MRACVGGKFARPGGGGRLERTLVFEPVTLQADAWGGAWGSGVTFHGHVAGLSAGSGAAFALLPAQNASGNWIKIVQRVPVRIALDPGDSATIATSGGIELFAFGMPPIDEGAGTKLQ